MLIYIQRLARKSTPYLTMVNYKYFSFILAMLTSVPFFIITVLVYLVIPELRNLHGKALCCYLSCLVVGYSCLGHTLIEGGIIVTDPLCEILGIFAYTYLRAIAEHTRTIPKIEKSWTFNGTKKNNLKIYRHFIHRFHGIFRTYQQLPMVECNQFWFVVEFPHNDNERTKKGTKTVHNVFLIFLGTRIVLHSGCYSNTEIEYTWRVEAWYWRRTILLDRW